MTHADVDRGIVNAIRKKLVLHGYLPDKSLYNNVPAYNAAKEAIKTGGKEIIDVYGIGNADKKDASKAHTIIVTRSDAFPGSIGGWPAEHFDSYMDGPTPKFRKYLYPDKTEDLEYEVRYITNSAAYDWVINQIIGEALGQRKYLKTTNEDLSDGDQFFLLEKKTNVDVSTGNLIEKLLRFNAVDLWLTPSELVRDNIPQMTAPVININPGWGGQ